MERNSTNTSASRQFLAFCHFEKKKPDDERKGDMDDDEFVKQLLEEFDKEFWEAMGKIR